MDGEEFFLFISERRFDSPIISFVFPFLPTRLTNDYIVAKKNGWEKSLHCTLLKMHPLSVGSSVYQAFWYISPIILVNRDFLIFFQPPAFEELRRTKQIFLCMCFDYILNITLPLFAHRYVLVIIYLKSPTCV